MLIGFGFRAPLALPLLPSPLPGIAVPENDFYTLSAQITEASGASCTGTTCYGTKGSDFPDLVTPPPHHHSPPTVPPRSRMGQMRAWSMVT